MIQSRAADRFSLLLLEENEFYLRDYAADYVPPASTERESVSKLQRGRLKICSMSIMFDPEDISKPIVRLPMRSFGRLGNYQRGSLLTSLDCKELLLVACKETITMKEHNMDVPYSFDKETQTHHFGLRYAQADDVLTEIMELWDICKEERHVVREAKQRHMLEQMASAVVFDKSLIVDAKEVPLLENRCNRVTPLVCEPGRLMISDKRIYFDPLNRVAGGLYGPNCLPLANVRRVAKRRHTLRHTGLELYYDRTISIDAQQQQQNMVPDTSGAWREPNDDELLALFLTFEDQAGRDRVYNKIMAQDALCHLVRDERANVTLRWQSGLLSNYEYLLYLNNLADRTVNDLAQYPVFPWVVADYESETLDLTNPKTFRDLSKPIGALNEARLKTFLERYNSMPQDGKRFLYGTHYSTPGYVLYYLVRSAPSAMLRLQNGLAIGVTPIDCAPRAGRFDAPDRLFFSLGETFNGCLENPTDLKELTPEFYGPCRGPLSAHHSASTLGSDQLESLLDLVERDDKKDDDEDLGSFLVNSKGLVLGTRASGERVDDVKVSRHQRLLVSPLTRVQLPPWAKSAADCIRQLRGALESDYVSAHLHHWIDLIFGYKQRGDAALRANNLFYHMTYEGAVDIDSVSDPNERRAIEMQISEFGQTPSQLFTTPHPQRLSAEKRRHAVSNAVQPTALKGFEHRLSADALRWSDAPGDVGQALTSYQREHLSSGELPAVDKDSSSYQWSFDVAKLQCVSSIKLHTDTITACSTLTNGSLLYTSSVDRSARIIDMATKTAIRTLSNISSMAISGIVPLSTAQVDKAVDTPLVLSSWDNNIYVYSPAYGRVLDTVGAHDDAVACIALRHQVLASGSWDTHLRIWALRESNIEPNPGLCRRGCLLAHCSAVGQLEFDDELRCVAIDQTGFCVVAGASDGCVTLYDTRCGKETQSWRAFTDSVNGLALTHEGARVVGCSTDGTLRVMDVRTGSEIFEKDVARELCSLISDDYNVMCGDAGGDLAVFSLESGELVHSLSEHESNVGALCIVNDGVVTASTDGVVKFWEMNN